MIGELIGDWIKGILIDGIMGNLSGLFSTVNTKVGEIASDVGATPQAWNSGIFNMLQSLSDTVIVPIAAAILAIIPASCKTSLCGATTASPSASSSHSPSRPTT